MHFPVISLFRHSFRELTMNTQLFFALCQNKLLLEETKKYRDLFFYRSRILYLYFDVFFTMYNILNEENSP